MCCVSLLNWLKTGKLTLSDDIVVNHEDRQSEDSMRQRGEHTRFPTLHVATVIVIIATILSIFTAINIV